jgi:hypothetical protein
MRIQLHCIGGMVWSDWLVIDYAVIFKIHIMIIL